MNAMLKLVRSSSLVLLLAFAFAAHAGPKEDIQADMQASRWEQADARLAKVLEEHPQNPLAHYWRAQTQARLGNLTGARASLEAAKRIDPSLKFASNPQVFAALEQQVGAAREQAAQPTREESLPPSIALEQAAPALDGLLPIFGVLLAAVIALGIIGTGISSLLERRDQRNRDKEQRRRQQCELQEAERDLMDALTVSDTSSDVSPEERLANHARISRALQEVRTQMGTLQSAKGPFEVGAVVGRAHHIVAEVRGEETPKARRERLRAEELERQERYRMESLRNPQPVRSPSSFASSPSSSQQTSGIDTAIIGGIAGFAAAAYASPSAAASRVDSSTPSADIGGYDFDTSSGSPTIDVGGSVGAGDSSFS